MTKDGQDTTSVICEEARSATKLAPHVVVVYIVG